MVGKKKEVKDHCRILDWNNRKDRAAITWNENPWEEQFEEEDKGSCKKREAKAVYPTQAASV